MYLRTVINGIPNAPDTIYGSVSGQCGTANQLYYVQPAAGATGYTWSVSDTNAAVITGTSAAGDSVWIDFASPYDSVTLYASVTNVCGTGLPDSLVIKGALLFPDTIGSFLSLCTGDSIRFAFPPNSYTLASMTTYLGGASMSSDEVNDTLYFYIWYEWESTDSVEVYVENECGSDYRKIYVQAHECEAPARLAQDTVPALQKERTDVELYPNPTTGITMLRFSNSSNAWGLLQITDITGRILLVKELKICEGINEQQLDLRKYEKGVYLLNLKLPDKNKTIRVMIQ